MYNQEEVTEIEEARARRAAKDDEALRSIARIMARNRRAARVVSLVGVLLIALSNLAGGGVLLWIGGRIAWFAILARRDPGIFRPLPSLQMQWVDYSRGGVDNLVTILLVNGPLFMVIAGLFLLLWKPKGWRIAMLFERLALTSFVLLTLCFLSTATRSDYQLGVRYMFDFLVSIAVACGLTAALRLLQISHLKNIFKR